MIIQTDEKSVTLTPFGSLALNGVANVSRDGGQSWIEIIRGALSQADQSRSDQPPRR
jgi:small-conductance mechanosensitive channel